MKYFHATALLALVMILATPAMAQRDANTSSARAAYSALGGINSASAVKKNKKKAKKAKTRKPRKIKMKDPQLARERRSSLHF